MNLADILDGLEKLFPILGTATGHPEIGALAARLLDLGEKELERRMNDTGMTRTETLLDAQRTFIAAKQANADLKKLGHEGDN